MSSSSSVNSLYSSSSRLTGLFSDLDTDSIVKDLCSSQQAKIDKEYQQQTTYQWKQDALNELSDAVKDFSNAYCSVLGTSSMLKNSTYTSYKATTSDTSSAVTLLADASSFEDTVKISVEQLAKNASVTSSGSVSKSGELSSKNTATLAELDFATPLTAGSDGNISFSINGKQFSFSTSTTLQTMINTINSDTDAGVTMKYSRLTDAFSITADDGGADSQVIIENISGNAFGTVSAFGIAEGTSKNGQNAKATINGVSVERNSNVFTIDGLTYELNDTTSQDISFKVARDYSATTDAVQDFVDALNTLVTKITSYTSAKDYSSDYPPLTESQKDEMTEDQIEKWESKAKSGILRNDSGLQSLVTNLKNAFFSSAGGTGTNATSIGISTASYFDDNAGELQLDTEALTKALASDPETVISIFSGGNSTVSSDQQGLVYKIKSSVSSYLKISNSTLDSISDKLDKIDTKMDDLNDKLSDLADKYYEKFSSMETALSKLNSSASMLSSMFSS